MQRSCASCVALTPRIVSCMFCSAVAVCWRHACPLYMLLRIANGTSGAELLLYFWLRRHGDMLFLSFLKSAEGALRV